MADPLSAAASIAGLIALASEVVKICYRCYGFQKAVLHASESFKKVIEELQLLRKVLLDLEDVYNRRTHELPSVTGIMKELVNCKVELENFRDRLVLKTGELGVVEKLKWPRKEKEVAGFIGRLQGFCSIFSAAQLSDNLRISMQSLSILMDMRSNMESTEAELQLNNIATWLSPLDFTQRQEELFYNRRHPRTGTWILKELEVVRWRSASPNPAYSSLFMEGPPGSGKTILCSVIVHALQKHHQKVPLAYIYCHFQEQRLQTPRNVIGSIAKQLVLRDGSPRSDAVCDILSNFYVKWKHQEPPVAALVLLVRRICEQLRGPYIVVDGIDEAEPITRKAVASLLSQLRPISTACLVSGRPYVFNTPELSAIKAIRLIAQPKEQEIITFVQSHLRNNENLSIIISGNRQLESAVVAKISSKAAGQFALARMYIQNIADQVCEADIMDELAQMGDSLPEEYEKSISRIRASAPKCKLAMRTLSWLVSARTSLSANELRDALAINSEDSYLRVDRRSAFQTIIDACQGFVIMNETVATVELFHFTAKEFLVSLHEINFLVESVIPQSPLVYLSYHNFKNPCTDTSELQKRVLQHPLCAYASTWWADHVRHGQHEGAARVTAFLASQNVFSSLQMLPTTSIADSRLFGKSLDYLGQPYPSGLFAAYLAVCFRLPKALESFLASNHNVSYSVPWGDNYAPLHAAILLGDVEMANILIQAGTNMNLRDQFGLTPLHLTLHMQSSSESRLVEILCNAGADLSALDQDDDTPLHIAAGLAENSSVSLLLSHGADVNAQNKRGRIALHEAVLREREDVIQTLLNHGADVLRPDQEGITPLRLCLDTGCYSIVETVLGRALQSSLVSPHLDVVAATNFLEPIWAHKASLENQEKKNLESYLSEEEYQREKSRRHELFFYSMKIANFGRGSAIHDLIIDVSDVNFIIDGALGWTPLHVAAENDRERVVFHLLAAGADSKLTDRRGRVPRDLATSPAVRRLLENDDWLDTSRLIFSGKGKGMILGRKLRDFYNRRRAELSGETIDPKWGGLLADSGIQPSDFDMFYPYEENEEWRLRDMSGSELLRLQDEQFEAMKRYRK